MLYVFAKLHFTEFIFWRSCIMASKFMNGKIRLSVIPKSYGKLEVYYFDGQEALAAHLKNVDYSTSKYLIVEYV